MWRKDVRKSWIKAKPKKRKYVLLENKTAQQLIKVADDWFSKYVRLRDSERVGDIWCGTCITCSHNGPVARIEDGALRFYAGWDAGHFISRGEKVTRYEEENVNLQCSFRCNRLRSGEHEKYKTALDAKYGDGTYRKLEKLAKDTDYYKFTKAGLMQIINDSKECIRVISLGL